MGARPWGRAWEAQAGKDPRTHGEETGEGWGATELTGEPRGSRVSSPGVRFQGQHLIPKVGRRERGPRRAVTGIKALGGSGCPDGWGGGREGERERERLRRERGAAGWGVKHEGPEARGISGVALSKGVGPRCPPPGTALKFRPNHRRGCPLWDAQCPSPQPLPASGPTAGAGEAVTGE